MNDIEIIREKVFPSIWEWNEGFKEAKREILDEDLLFMHEERLSVGAAYVGMLTVYGRAEDGSSYYEAQIGSLFDTMAATGAFDCPDTYEDRIRRWNAFEHALAKGLLKWMSDHRCQKTESSCGV